MLPCGLMGVVMNSSAPLDANPDAGPARDRRRDRVLGWAFTAGVHLAVLAGLLWPRSAPPPVKPSPSLLMVNVADNPKPPGPPDAGGPGGRFNEVQPSLPQPVSPTFVTARRPDNSLKLLPCTQNQFFIVYPQEGLPGKGGRIPINLSIAYVYRQDLMLFECHQPINFMFPIFSPSS